MKNKKIFVSSLLLLPLLITCKSKSTLKIVLDCNGGYLLRGEEYKDVLEFSLNTKNVKWIDFVTEQEIGEPTKDSTSNTFDGWYLSGEKIMDDYVITCSILVIAHWK